MAKGFVSRVLLAILSLLKIALATAIIIIVAARLYQVTVFSSADGNVWAYKTKCLMSGEVRDHDVCAYTYAVCGLSLLISLLTSILLCVTCDLCGLGTWLEFIVMAFLTAWWVIASIVISDKVRATNDAVLPNGQPIPQKNWRNAVAVMAWVTALLACIAAIILLTECVKSLAECCCGGRKKKEKYRDEERAGGHDAAQPVDYGTPQPHHQQAPAQVTPPGNEEVARANAM